MHVMKRAVFFLVGSVPVLAVFAGIMAGGAAAQEPKLPKMIKRVDIVHMSHTDIGFTDHPAVTREQQMRYLDIAIDGVLQTETAPPEACFVWTAESALTVDDWWQKNTPERRQDLIRAIKTGRLEITALAMNQTPTLSADQWHTTLHWLPEEVWNAAQPRTGIQNDVNGFPRAGANALLKRNVNNLWMGINATNGQAPFEVPMGFYWRMPDDRRIFVWLGDSYPNGFYYFFADSWRRGPVPESTDTRYRPPRRGEFYPTDEPALRKAHARLCERLGALEARGYKHPVLPLSVTSEWRMDNDPPFLGMADFVAAWNRLKLQPELRMTTVSQAIDDVKPATDAELPEYTGEFTDWWANGCASGPREVAASRRAKRNLNAALSPVWGATPDANTLSAADALLRELCLFDEHTWGSADSIGLPHDIDTLGQYNEKARTAYHPLAMSKVLLAQRARTAVYPLEHGYYVANTAPDAWSGWVTMKATALREKVGALENPLTGATTPVEVLPGYAQFTGPANANEMTAEADNGTVADNAPGQLLRFWMDKVGPRTTVRLVPGEKASDGAASSPAPAVAVDDNGWPTSVQWPEMNRPLFTESPGDFVGVELVEPSGRWKYNELLQSRDEARRKAAIKETAAEAAGKTTVVSNGHTTVYTQSMKHPRLKWMTRTLEVYHSDTRAVLTVRLYRISSELPEWFYIGCALPTGDTLPVSSCGGFRFVPFEDQLPHSCRDHFAIDSWLDYGTADGKWLWVSRDAPLVSFGGPQPLKHLESVPPGVNKAYALVFDNTWMTNFVADSHGVFEFRFDLVWRDVDGVVTAQDAADLAETLLSEPQVVIQPDLKEDPIFMERLYKP
jgi:hypothetical protein